MSEIKINDADAVLAVMLRAARKAARAVQLVYSTPNFDVEMKGPNDPVTRADKQANAIILAELAKEFPGVPIVAEESAPETYADFQNASAAFFVDPLDGTREFVAKNGEFCVMIGLAIEGVAKLGVVVEPTCMRAFVGASGLSGVRGAWEVDQMGARREIHVAKKEKLKDADCIISRSHRSPETDAIMAAMGCKKMIPYGSAGLKGLKVAQGEVDLYCHPGPAGSRWDSCAVEAIVRGAGGMMTDASGNAFNYRAKSIKNLQGVLCGNPTLHEKALAVIGPILDHKRSSKKKSSPKNLSVKKPTVKKSPPKKSASKTALAKKGASKGKARR